MQADDRSQLIDKVLVSRTLVAKFEIMLYALPDYFMVYVDDNERPLEKTYMVTRSRRAYEHSEDSRKRYRQLVSPNEMYNIIKRHLEYERRRLKNLENSSDEPVQIKDKKLKQLTAILTILRRKPGANILLELQPRWLSRSDDEDELYEEAVSLVARTQVADVTLIRDNLTIGQALASKLMQRLEDEGLVSTLSDRALRRTVFITVEDMQEREVAKHAAK